MRRSLVLLLLLLCPGCSFWAVRGPAPDVPGGGVCTTSAAVPVIDGVFAAGLAGLGVAALAEGKPACSSGSWVCLDYSGAAQGAGAALIALAAVETAAAVYGGSKVARCREAHQGGVGPVQAAPGLDLRYAASVR
ncbi:MAG TPA: hypothetical protein VLT82_09710 [Myxococcaceae bacterium]|nr:hypothetical protein [Myxococcaceae bacterium]